METTLQEHDKVLISVGTYLLHISYNAFCEGLKMLSADFNIDVDQVVLDLYGFFKYSAKKIHDYFHVETFTELQECIMLKQIPPTWTTI